MPGVWRIEKEGGRYTYIFSVRGTGLAFTLARKNSRSGRAAGGLDVPGYISIDLCSRHQDASMVAYLKLN